MPPYLSIIIPMFNREQFIARALRSCLEQEFRDFEVIVTDDASADGSVAEVRRAQSDAELLPGVRCIIRQT